MNGQEFKDQLSVQLIPMFTQLMTIVKSTTTEVLGQPATSSSAMTLPDPKVVANHVYNFVDACAEVREERISALVQKAKAGHLTKGTTEGVKREH